MGRIAALVVLASVALVGTAQAAEPRRVARSEALGGPAFAGNAVIYAGVNRGGGVELRRAGVGAQRVLTPLGRKLPAQGFAVSLSGSASGIAVARANYTGFLSLAGPTGGPFASRPTTCPDRDINVIDSQSWRPVAVDGDRLAYVREVCRGSRAVERYVVVENITTGERIAELPTGSRLIALDGRFLAHRDPWSRDALHVYDLDAGRVVYGMHVGQLFGFDVDNDGTLVASEYAYSGCEGDLKWASPASQRWHDIESCDAAAPLQVHDGRVAFVRATQIRVADFGNRGRNYGGAGVNTDGFGFDGRRLVYSTQGCGPDSGGVWIKDLMRRAGTYPALPKCRVTLPKVRTIRIDRKNRVTVRVTCPTGCRGYVDLQPASEEGFYASRAFELQRGQVAHLRMTVRRPRSGFRGKRTTPGRLRATIDPPRGANVVVQRRVIVRR